MSPKKKKPVKEALLDFIKKAKGEKELSQAASLCDAALTRIEHLENLLDDLRYKYRILWNAFEDKPLKAPRIGISLTPNLNEGVASD